jgi:hypothetical protein
LAWADAFRETTGRWPTLHSGSIAQEPFESWFKVDAGLRLGLRGLPGGSSLARLLAERRGARNIHDQPSLTIEQILHWADAHREHTGRWPTSASGTIPGSGGEKWKGVNRALVLGLRSLPVGSSLARLLAEQRDKRNCRQLPPLSEEQILHWADRHRHQAGGWPHRESGPVGDAPGETWKGVDMALRQGGRGLDGGSGLALLLADRRGVRNVWTRPNLSLGQILAWADAHHQRTGSWPSRHSGHIAEAPEETWQAVAMALHKGSRGLPGGSSLARLLAAERGVRNRLDLPRYTSRKILVWADRHFRRTGQWPTRHSGAIQAVPDMTWLAIDDCLRDGCRGLAGGSSLARLLAEHRGVRNPAALPPLSKKKILAWADAHFHRTGTWPTSGSGVVFDAPAENWHALDQALRKGYRGLAGGTALRRLLIAKGRLPSSGVGQRGPLKKG